MPDDFASHETGLNSPARSAAPISPNDSADLAQATRGIYVGQQGSLRLRLISGDIVTFSNVQAGMIYPLRVAQVFATGTTASDIIALQ